MSVRRGQQNTMSSWCSPLKYGGRGGIETQILRNGTCLAFSHEPLGQAAIRSHWLQTQFATYILEEPHQGHKICHDNQTMLMAITRRLIQAVRIRPNCSLPNALNKFQRVAREIRNEEVDEQSRETHLQVPIYYRSDFGKKPRRMKAEREPSQEVW